MVLLPNRDERKTRRHLRRQWGVAKTGQVSKQGTVEQWEHWDGSVDANVKLPAFRIRVHPTLTDPAAHIAALEAAVRAHERARGPLERARTLRVLEAAKAALEKGI